MRNNSNTYAYEENSSLFIGPPVAGHHSHGTADAHHGRRERVVIHTQVVAPFTPVYIYKMKIEGDTVVGATLCKKLHTTKMDASGNILYRSTSYCQQHGDKFYKGNNIMFDMGLEEGGIYRYISPEDYIVTSVRDTVLADGKKRKCMDLNLYYTDGESGEKKIAPVVSDIWVEKQRYNICTKKHTVG